MNFGRNSRRCPALLFPFLALGRRGTAVRLQTPPAAESASTPDGMDEDASEPDPSRQRNGVAAAAAAAALRGEFSDAADGTARYAVSLTDRALTVQKIGASPGPGTVAHSLRDCVGCRAFPAEGGADAAAYLCAYFYPWRRRWLSLGTARQRVELRLRVASLPDARANLEEAERWARAVGDATRRDAWRRGGVVCGEVPRPCRVMLLLNPQSGRGQAQILYTTHIQRMLTEAAVPHTLFITDRQNHARELVREADLSQWDALVILSGDGLLFEVVNGLMEREDWEEAIQTPLGILPGGSGNALAASINYYSGSPYVYGEELLVSCGFLLARGLLSPLDLVSLHLASGRRVFSFLSLAWGFVADVDIESERYRQVGTIRFMVGTAVRLAGLRVYQGRLAFLPISETEEKPPEQTSTSPSSPTSSLCSSMSCGTTADTSPNHSPLHPDSTVQSNTLPSPCHPVSVKGTANHKGPPDSLLVPLDQSVPADWTVVKEQDFVLVLAIYQSHLAEDLQAAPQARAQDGAIHLYYVLEGISRPALLQLLLAMERGTHMTCGCPYLVYHRVRALRLEPLSPQGVITVDGEQVEYGPVQAQVHGGLARLITG
ncbi:sphingosine kinase 1 [Denticeps clupeoides]|uniref:sphingosine kinase n=1 Tax=Denticeps clupeoides TaxID=299321 RepID=A0AAY4C705_9TELE|nr:sphingosine kinase 1-like [Denticeps clupeoides]